LDPPPAGFLAASPKTKGETDYPVYATIEYDCLDGDKKLSNYEIRGDANYRYCKDDGTWSTPVIYCQGLKIHNCTCKHAFSEVFCALPNPINSSDNAFQKLKLKGSASLTCLKGFEPSSGKFTCDSVDKSEFTPDFQDLKCNG
jgi:hypothetical protein